MVRRLLRWILVALTAVFVAQMLLRAGSRTAAGAQPPPAHSDRMAAMPWAPASHARGRSAGVMPPMA